MPKRVHLAILLTFGLGVLLMPATAAAGSLTPSPSPLEFTSAPVGFTQVKAVTLTNAETTTTVEAAKLEEEEPAGQFAIESSPGSDCEGAALEEGHSCVVEIIFHPTSAGEKKATLVVESDAADNPVKVALVGVAIAPEFAISPFSFNFSEVKVGSKSSAKHFSVENGGSDVGVIEAVTVTGGNVGQFEITASECKEELKPGERCSFAVLFAPTSAGSKSASVEVKSNAPESPQTITVSGTGVSPAPAPAAPAQAVAPARPTNVFSFGKVIFNKRRGIASLPVRVPGPGSLLLGGKGLIARRGPGSALVLGGAGTVRLAIVAAGHKEAALNRTGRAKLVARVTYIPAGGDALTKTKKIGLVKRR